VAAVEAARQAGILQGEPGRWELNHEPLRTGVFIGSTQGEVAGIETAALELEAQKADEKLRLGTHGVNDIQLALKGIPGMVQGHVAMALQARGPSSCPSAACASGSQAIGLAGMMVLNGLADVMVAGGADAVISPVGVSARQRLGVLSTRNGEPERASRPWDAERDGFVMGEGAGVVVVTTEAYAKAHGYPIYAYLAGFGMSSDASSLSAPSPEGQARARGMALAQAGLSPSQIGYVHAHGTSTARGDVAELASLKLVFGEHVTRMRVSSTKAHMGHLLGASGSVGAIVGIQGMLAGWAAPTINLERPGLAEATGFGIDERDMNAFQLVPQEAEPIDVDAIAVNSFGLGGQNAVLVFVRPQYWLAP
jgi:3-oxoacyl-[acyl-carrier-protein] synthase II